MAQIILNCDLGENEALEQTEQLLRLIDAANIGCGFHAGSPDKTRSSIALALKHGVKIGAHPGIVADAGRGQDLPSSDEFQNLLKLQIGSFQAAAHSLGTTAKYIKLHGSLYHAVETQPQLAITFIKFLQQQAPGMATLALSGGTFAQAAEAAGLRVLHEAFADRDYLPDGSLVPRSEEGAVLAKAEALSRLMQWAQDGTFPTRGGAPIALAVDSLCVHGDSPGAIELIQNLRAII